MALDSVISQQSDKVSPQSTGGNDWASGVVEEMTRPGGSAHGAASGHAGGGSGRSSIGSGEAGSGASAGSGGGEVGAGGISGSGVADAGSGDAQPMGWGSLPPLVLRDERPIERADQIQPAQEKNWTVAIDLAVSFGADSHNPNGGGVNRYLPELLKLAKETTDSSVNFIVHAEQPIDQSRIKCDAFADKRAEDSCIDIANQTNLATTERYFVHDGKVDILPDENYKNPQDGLKALLTEAQKYAPSKNVGLIINSHGMGADGLYANTGQLPMHDLTKTVQDGLAGSGHTKLDFFDFDACDMADANVMKDTSGIANDVVASAGMEFVSPKYDSQNLPKALSALLANDNMSGKDLGKMIVDQATMGANGEGMEVVTPTLANFDLTQYGDFQKSLDAFGKALTDIASDAHNAAVLKGDTDLTRAFASGVPPQDNDSRDLKTFTQNILKDVDSNNFNGDTKSLEESANNLLQSLNQVVPQKFGEAKLGYGNIGGMAVEIPGSEILDKKKLAEEINPLARMTDALDSSLTKDHGVATKDLLVEYLNRKSNSVPEKVREAYQKQFEQIQNGEDNIMLAGDELTFAVAVVNLKAKLTAIEHGPMGKTIDKMAPEVQKEHLAKPSGEITPNWDDFIKKMKTEIS